MCQGAQQEAAGERGVVVGYVTGEASPTKLVGLCLHFSTLSASRADKKGCSRSITGWFLLRGESSGSAGTVAAMPPSFWSRGGSKQLTSDSTCSRLATHQQLIPFERGKDALHTQGRAAGRLRW